MKVVEAIEKLKEAGFDWRLAVINNEKYLEAVYKGIMVRAYPIKGNEVELEQIPSINPLFERIVESLYGEPVYYSDDWWIIAQVGDVEVSTDGEIVSVSSTKKVNPSFIEKLVGVHIDNVRMIIFSESIIVVFNDDSKIEVEYEAGDVGIVGVSPGTVDQLKELYGGVALIKRLMEAAIIHASKYGYIVWIHDDRIELPPKISYVIKKSKEYSFKDVTIIPTNFRYGKPGELYAVGKKYIAKIKGDENLEKYKKIYSIIGEFGGEVGDSVEIVSDKVVIIDDYFAFSDVDAAKKLIEIIEVPESFKELIKLVE